MTEAVNSFEKSYLGQLRGLVGARTLLVPSVRAVAFDGQDRVVLVRRSDDGTWVFPGGFMELGESVAESLRREVREETGLEVLSSTLVAIHSDPRFTFTNVYGSSHQLLNLVFRIDEWEGRLMQESDETVECRFFAQHELPEVSLYEREVLQDCKRYSGQVILN